MAVGAGVIATANSKLKRVCKRVAWADEVGRSLTSEETSQPAEVAVLGSCSGSFGGRRAVSKHEDDNVELCAFKERRRDVIPERSAWGFHPRRGSYKEALLRSSACPSSAPPPTLVQRPFEGRKSRGRAPFGSRCFRCLAPDHRVAVCRDPVRCLVCRRAGHRASQCKSASDTAGATKMNLNRVRANRQGGASID